VDHRSKIWADSCLQLVVEVRSSTNTVKRCRLSKLVESGAIISLKRWEVLSPISAADVTVVMEKVTPKNAGYMKVEWVQTKTGLSWLKESPLGNLVKVEEDDPDQEDDDPDPDQEDVIQLDHTQRVVVKVRRLPTSLWVLDT